MGQLVLGLATMNAGLGQPGSSLKNLLEYKYCFDKIICVDGSLQNDGREIYSQYGVDLIISNPWKGSLKEQYDFITTHLKPGDWWVMMDDDEIPSEGLAQLFQKMQTNLERLVHPLSGMINNPDKIKAISTARVTCFTEDGENFYPGEHVPTMHNMRQPGVAGPRPHIFLYDEGLRMMHSPAGRHVVPYHPDAPPIYLYSESIYHMHLKAPEMYVFNDCVKAIKDDDIKDPDIRREFREVIKSNGITNEKEFMDKTLAGDVNGAFIDFCMKYSDRGAPEGRMFIWYYLIAHPDKNPYRSYIKINNSNTPYNWKEALRLILNDNWRATYCANRHATLGHIKGYPLTPYPKGGRPGDIT